MASENETVAEVARQMRRNEEVFHHLYWCEYADRIEAAHGREVAELRECLSEAAARLRKMDKQKFIHSVIHRYWSKRKPNYYARYRKAVSHV